MKEPVAPTTPAPPTGAFAVATASLREDRIVQVVGLALGGLALVFAFPSVGSTARSDILLRWAPPIWTLLLAWAFLPRAEEPRGERRLWSGLSVAWGIWAFSALLASFGGAGSEPASLAVTRNVLAALSLLVYASALEAAPHRERDERLVALESSFGWPATALLAVGLFAYFFVFASTPDDSGLALDQQRFVFFFGFDVYLVVRSFQLWASATDARWRILYGCLGISLVGFAAADLLASGLVGQGAAPSGTALDVLWTLPFLPQLLAARWRHHLSATASGSEEDPRDDFRDRTVLLVATLPLLHLGGYSLGLLEPASRDARSLLVAVWIVVLGLLATLQQRAVSRRARAVADETERQRRELREKELRLEHLSAWQAAQERFAKVFYGNPDPTLINTLDDGVLLDVNPAFCEISGFSRDEVLGRSGVELGVWTETDGREMAERLRHGPVRGLEVPMQGKEGRVLDMLLSVDRVEVDGEQCVLTVAKDVTERNELERQLFRIQRMESLGTLAGGMAHDLNNVLSPISMSVQLLQRGVPEDKRERILSILEVSARRGRELVRSVLGFARGADGERTDVDVGELVEELATVIRDTFPKTLEIEIDVPEDLEPVRADPTQVHQVLLNLCVNARDAMEGRGRLGIRAADRVVDEAFCQLQPEAIPGRFVALEVSDTGSGIPPEIRDRIFDPFFSTKRAGEGTGIGLSTVRSIVRSHGGFLSLYSEAGRGSRFSVHLPASGDERVDVAEDLDVLPAGSGELVLVVDDETAVRTVLREVLETWNYRVLEAGDGREALLRLEEAGGEIRVVLLDIMMPVRDGTALLDDLLERADRPLVIVSSGLEQPSEAGADANVPKPFTAAELLGTLARLLHGVPPEDATPDRPLRPGPRPSG